MAWVVCGVVSAAMAAAAGGFWWQARGHDRALLSYRAAAAEIENIGRIASDWRQATSRVWANALADVATLDSFAAEIARHRQNLARALLGLPRMSARLANDLSAYDNAIDAHAERVARFQSDLATARAATPTERATVAKGATVALLDAATSIDLDPFAAALGDTLESAAAATVRVVARNHGTAVALASGLPLPWLALAMMRGKGGLASSARQRPGTSPRAPRAFIRRRDASGSRANAVARQTAPTIPRDAAEDLPPTGDARATYALVRARVLAEFLAEELASMANDIDDERPRARLADLANGLATTAVGSNSHYDVLDVNECVDEAVAAGSRRGFVTVTKQLGVVPPVFAPRAEIVVLLANIVENAVRAARQRHGDGGEIAVATADGGGKAVVTIADNGAGLSAGRRASEPMFEPFRALRDEHLGIGLAMASELAVRNGGTVALASVAGEKGGADGRATGAVARITLPLA